MKTCTKCGVEKPMDQFSRHIRMPSGRRSRCKDCTNKEKRDDYIKSRPQDTEYRTIERISAESSRTKEQRDRKNKWCKIYRSKNRQKYLARNLLRSAVRGGKVLKQSMCACGSTKWMEAHHKDYLKPLEVVWMCSKCHRDWHKNNIIKETI